MWSTVLCLPGLDRAHEELLNVLAACHYKAALANQNASSMFVRAMADLGQTFEASVAAGLGTLGEKHGPVATAREAIFTGTGDEFLRRTYFNECLPVPGFGNSFFKEDIDPSFDAIEEVLFQTHVKQARRIYRVCEWINKPTVWPNAAAFTAAVAEIIGMEPGTEGLLFMLCRLPAWASIYSEAR